MEVVNYLNKNVSYQKDTWASFSKEITIGEILNEIKNGTYKVSVDRLRQILNDGDAEAYKAEKLRLPAVTFCGTFNESRKKEQLKEYNSLIVIDIDKLSLEELNRIKDLLITDEYVFALWVSPSNNGIKGLVALNFNFDLKDNLDNSHKSAFNKLKKYFEEHYQIILDGSGSDTTRLCFVSYDESLVLKATAKEFAIEQEDLSIIYTSYEKEESTKVKIRNLNFKDALYNPNGKNKNFQRSEIKLIINFLTKKNISIADEYENRYRLAYAICNSFTFDIGKKYFLEICSLDKNYNESKAIKLLEYCYENNTGWTKYNFIKELVKNNGYNK